MSSGTSDEGAGRLSHQPDQQCGELGRRDAVIDVRHVKGVARHLGVGRVGLDHGDAPAALDRAQTRSAVTEHA